MPNSSFMQLVKRFEENIRSTELIRGATVITKQHIINVPPYHKTLDLSRGNLAFVARPVYNVRTLFGDYLFFREGHYGK